MEMGSDMAAASKLLTRREFNALTLKNKILNTALNLFSKHGYEKIRVEDIAKYAGISKGTFYYYFSSKDAVLVEQFHKIDEHYEQVFRNIPEEESAAGRLLAFAQAVSEYCSDVCGINVIKIVYANQISTGKRPPIINNPERIFYRIVADIARRGKAEGLFPKDIPDEELTELLTRVTRSLIYDWCLYDGRFDLQTIARQRFSFLLDMFTALAKNRQS
jgi:AcrR family transcriptional regulator